MNAIKEVASHGVTLREKPVESAEEDAFTAAMNLIELLVADPTKRLGAGFTGPIEILSHEFFIEIAAESVAKALVLPPYKFKESDDGQLQNMLGFPKLEKYTGDQHLFDGFSDCLQEHNHRHYSSDGHSEFKTIRSE